MKEEERKKRCGQVTRFRLTPEGRLEPLITTETADQTHARLGGNAGCKIRGEMKLGSAEVQFHTGQSSQICRVNI